METEKKGPEGSLSAQSEQPSNSSEGPRTGCSTIPDHDPYTHHLSDRQHFKHSTDPKDGHHVLGAYAPGFMFNDDGA